jgi:hypothetical protein
MQPTAVLTMIGQRLGTDAAPTIQLALHRGLSRVLLNNSMGPMWIATEDGDSNFS